MKKGSILILVSLFVACSSKEKTMHVLDFGIFKLRAPTDWHIVKKQGTDSYVGGLTNGSDSCWFDYGRYDVEFPNDSGYWCRFSEDTVNGFPAVFSIPDSSQPGDVTMKIPGLASSDRFTIWASKVMDIPTVLRIYKSTMFRGSDSSTNPPLKEVKYFDRTNADGKMLFVANCQACHTMRGQVDGPRIQDLIVMRNAEWLHRFFTDKDL
ncbi:MAG: c-type cytochrome [Chitinophagaceae bacterium]|nr:c-type cytochrome [Chitinophagaceae bacterium]